MAEWDLTLFDRSGNPLGEVETDAVVYWELNGVGSLEFTISQLDPIVREGALRFRNPVLFRHDAAGWWGGVLWTPRGWTSGRRLRVKAYSAEHLFKIRRGPANTIWKGSAGDIFRQIVQDANSVEDTRIRLGDVWTGGKSHQETSRDDRLYDAITRVQGRSGNDWFLTPDFDNGGRLIFLANWFKQAGEKNAFSLAEGVNMNLSDDDDILTEQGDIFNDVVVSGIGASIESRPRGFARDQASIDKYGLCQASDNSDAEEVGTLNLHAKTFVDENKEPRNTRNPRAQDAKLPDGSTTFEGLRLGNTGTLSTSLCGFYGDAVIGTETTARIKARELSTATQLMELVIDEVLT